MATRYQNYDRGLNPVRIAENFTARKPDMLSQESMIMVALEAIEGLVRGSLSGVTGATAPTCIESPFYQAAAKQMYKVTTHWAGGGIVDKEMATLITKWSDRGLSSTVLTQIAYEVFHWSPPAP